ncbi:hypothetical protein [Neptuniibacter sp.]|uniref:hypothetical protein n=1 Tax=Neptuniibacter sp. TaxID=1962643 RepID=UPI002607D5D3|nr:hypothetical protein [Neptuniibacter sp.]MCP4597069.1 hypothetical protein [Neptuniibacter sp.]
MGKKYFGQRENRDMENPVPVVGKIELGSKDSVLPEIHCDCKDKIDLTLGYINEEKIQEIIQKVRDVLRSHQSDLSIETKENGGKTKEVIITARIKIN